MPAGPRCPVGPFEALWFLLEPYVPAMSEPFEPFCSFFTMALCLGSGLHLCWDLWYPMKVALMGSGLTLLCSAQGRTAPPCEGFV